MAQLCSVVSLYRCLLPPPLFGRVLGIDVTGLSDPSQSERPKVISSIPVASTNISFIINGLLAHFDFVQQLSAAADPPPGSSVFPSHRLRTNRTSDTKRTQGVVLGHSLLPAYVAKHIQLLLVFSPHAFFLSGCAVETREFSGTSIVIWEGSLCHNVASWRIDPKQYGEADLFRSSYLPYRSTHGCI